MEVTINPVKQGMALFKLYRGVLYPDRRNLASADRLREGTWVLLLLDLN